MNLSWKNKIQPQPQTINEAQEIINNISEVLMKQVCANNVSISQLNKIYNLATNTERLKRLLILL